MWNTVHRVHRAGTGETEPSQPPVRNKNLAAGPDSGGVQVQNTCTFVQVEHESDYLTVWFRPSESGISLIQVQTQSTQFLL